MKRFALIALLCLLNSLSVTADEFSETKALVEQGDADAQYSLGIFYAIGRGIPQNYVESYVWNSLAAASGFGEAVHEDAVHNRNIIAKELSLADLRAAQKRVANLFAEIQARKE